jgi:cell wall-associated NlpC family hydrolase
VEDFSRIGIGDLVFFDADSKDGSQIDHVGMYLGRDSEDHHRFISSRKRADGPTMGDLGEEIDP